MGFCSISFKEKPTEINHTRLNLVMLLVQDRDSRSVERVRVRKSVAQLIFDQYTNRLNFHAQTLSERWVNAGNYALENFEWNVYRTKFSQWFGNHDQSPFSQIVTITDSYQPLGTYSTSQVDLKSFISNVETSLIIGKNKVTVCLIKKLYLLRKPISLIAFVSNRGLVSTGIASPAGISKRASAKPSQRNCSMRCSVQQSSYRRSQEWVSEEAIALLDQLINTRSPRTSTFAKLAIVSITAGSQSSLTNLPLFVVVLQALG